jgi:cell wall-associated NlpC family hydrolase
MMDRFYARQVWRAVSAAGLLAALTSGFSAPTADDASSTGNIPVSLSNALARTEAQFAPDPHAVIFKVEAIRENGHYALRGDVDNVEAKKAALANAARTGLEVDDQITVLPDKSLGDHLWGIATLSVVNVREKPDNPAEMGTQVLTGEAFTVWKKEGNWYLIQTACGYVGWTEGGGFANCTRAEADRWNASPRLIVTAYEERILERPSAEALPVSDVVMGSQVEPMGASGNWVKVRLADGRCGFLPKKAATDYAAWKASRRPTPENIERTAREFLGRPYSWGGNSIRGLDCSGLTGFVFFLNGIQLRRNASEQCRQGVEVPLGDDLKHLKKGDLLFFGHRAAYGQPEKVIHTAIYLGDKVFIQSSERVRISSLDRQSPESDPHRINTLLHARRILPEP